MDLREIETWFADRPKWLQDAARRLVQTVDLSEKDYRELLSICKNEANGQDVAFTKLPVGSLASQDPINSLRLESIASVQGINALRPRKPLEFGKKPLCIVYGRNGSGKSGYVRLLKHACGTRRPGDLLGNIFTSSAQPQSADFTFNDGSKTTTSQWTGTALHELRGVEIYDTACGLVYVNEEDQVTYEPWLLRLFTKLTEACTSLAQHIKTEIEGKVSAKPIFPQEYATTTAATWYAGITGKTKSKEVEENTAWKHEDEIELSDTNRRLAEPNPNELAVKLRRQISSTIGIVDELKSLSQSLADSKCEEYLRANANATSKRKAADEDAARIFAKAPLSGIGSETWRLMWESARKYSEEYAYKKSSFPNVVENSRCVLCQRELDVESRERFISFEN